MTSNLYYKGYFGTAKISLEDEILFGRLRGISDVVTYEGTTVGELKKAFEETVDEYIKTMARNRPHG